MKEPKAEVASIDQYIQGFPKDVQALLSTMRAVIAKAAPQATEKISYQMPTFYLNGNLVHFAAFASHIGFYPAPSGVSAFKEELGAYTYAKGSIQFPIDKPLPLELIKRIVEFRASENSKMVDKRKKK